MDNETRKQFAEIAIEHATQRKIDRAKIPTCPYISALGVKMPCNKKGGVCSIQPVTQGSGGRAELHPEGLVSVCPQRFLEEKGLMRWVAEVMLGDSSIKAVREMSFLTSSSPTEKKIQAGTGRIDWLLVDDSQPAIRYCALEVQALYFSGHNMLDDFKKYEQSGDSVFPEGNRRPDYRSSGPKRLAPQLSVKVPLLRNWGIKTAVLVDRYFFNQMANFTETVGDNHQDRLAASDIVWFVADYSGGELVPGEIRYSSLGDSIKALNAVEVMSRQTFESKLKATLSSTARSRRYIDLQF
ncbi:hypothetical protein IWX64_003400 [Arthrobacter sp. CAN_A212]|uniref:NotI family restriction endonuclease n=1 Tax=Arthrobacter sp. CAN_A212 TaxID=2787719 RepID=UPI0018CB2B96